MEKVSVIIPFYNRSSKIGNTLGSLAAQTFRQFEIVIVNDGSKKEETEKLIEISRSFSGMNIRIINQVNSGAAAAINNDIHCANHELILLFDDDIILEKNTIEKHLSHHRQFPGSLLCGTAHAELERFKNDIEKYKQYMEEIWKIKRPDLLKKVKVNYENFVITTCNTSLSKSTFDNIGGFNVAFRDGYDVEFGIRALRKNVEIYFDPDIKTIHDDNITLSYYGKRQKAYIEARMRIAESNPEIAGKILKNITLEPGSFKRVIYKLMRSKFWLNFIEGSRIKFLFPKTVRYKLYGMTIAALSQRHTNV